MKLNIASIILMSSALTLAGCSVSNPPKSESQASSNSPSSIPTTAPSVWNCEIDKSDVGDDFLFCTANKPEMYAANQENVQILIGCAVNGKVLEPIITVDKPGHIRAWRDGTVIEVQFGEKKKKFGTIGTPNDSISQNMFSIRLGNSTSENSGSVFLKNVAGVNEIGFAVTEYDGYPFSVRMNVSGTEELFDSLDEAGCRY